MSRSVSWFGKLRYLFRKFVAHGRVRVILQFLFAKFQAIFIQPTILPYFVTFFPYKRSSYAYVVRKVNRSQEFEFSRLPVPPEKLWLGYGKTAEEWLESGQRHVAVMRNLLAESDYHFGDGHRVLELGCAAGRMLRCLEDVSDRCEIWGTDISGEHIYWCKQQLNPPFHFFITTTAPHLPFGDGYFDLIFAGSVFTHIDDLADAWLLELRRLLKPGGRLYITIHDNETVRILREQRELDLSRTLFCRSDFFKDNDYAMFTIGRFMRSQVFFDRDYLIRTLSPWFEICSIASEAYGFQTGYLLRRL